MKNERRLMGASSGWSEAAGRDEASEEKMVGIKNEKVEKGRKSKAKTRRRVVNGKLLPVRPAATRSLYATKPCVVCRKKDFKMPKNSVLANNRLSINNCF